MNLIIDSARANPVLVLDFLKAALAVLIVFGIPIPPGLDVALAVAVVAALSLVTRAKVTPVASLSEPEPAAPAADA